jgi:hypothetical protein
MGAVPSDVPAKVLASFTRGFLRGCLENSLQGRTEIGLTDIKRALFNVCRNELGSSVDDGRLIASVLKEIGWRRDGWLYTGYDRTPRYTPTEGGR